MADDDYADRERRGCVPVMETYAEAMACAKREYLTRVMEMADGNVTLAARIANKNRTEFFGLLRKHAPGVRRNRQAPHLRDPVAWSANARRASQIRWANYYRREGNAAWKALSDTPPELLDWGNDKATDIEWRWQMGAA